ncbi:MAG TPA: HAMP domain-containing sensor histidine kinase [Chitinophagaceae bacterium]|nr:HAMP domain-containing sensor histidine kinase [Chitinophagaceae bacterium]
MLRQAFGWKAALALVAVLIVIGTIFYSKYLAGKIAAEERQKVEQWIEAGKYILNSPPDADTRLASMIITQNKDIPIIETNERDSIITYVNLDSTRAARDSDYVGRKMAQFRGQGRFIEWVDARDPGKKNRYYYGHTRLLDEVRYYPIVQLLIVGLFILVVIFLIRSNYRSIQNQVWAGMAKETAHQLGTPVSSLEGWIEMLKEQSGNERIVAELEKDVGRLQLISDRFSKIGSKPRLEEVDLGQQIRSMVEYMRKRATGRVSFSVNVQGEEPVRARVSPPLFDWVIENLMKNSLDAMEGRGSIRVDIIPGKKSIYVDLTDTGKGIPKPNFDRVFKPGFTTKKRGWGLGLSLSRRIIEQYHHGQIFVRSSEPGKGTTFRIILKNSV